MPSTTAELVHSELERAELLTVLTSPLFVRSPTLAHLLSYLCEKKFAGDTDQIKEYSLALEVFGRPESFDQDTDSIVRVQANRLRKRLSEYYSSEGATHALRIVIPLGQYVPSFEKGPSLGQPVSQSLPIAPSAPSNTELKAISSAWTSRGGMLLVATLALAVLAMAGFVIRERLKTRPAVVSGVQPAPSLPESVVGLPVGHELRILAGASRNYVDRAGKLWNADAYFAGGKPVRSPVQHIWRTQDPSIYRNSRQGDFRYDIPLKPGTYELRLHFAETYYGPEEMGGGGEGSRVMNITTNGEPLLNDLDVVLDAGGSRSADVKVFTGLSPAGDGQLHLSFSSARGGSAMLSAIEILPGLQESQRPVRIVTRDVPYYSDDSRWWGPDSYFKGGQLTASNQPTMDADDPEMYETERWGHFSYAIPVAPGRYIANFYFIERRFDAANRDRYGESSDANATGGRLFSVFCNGKVILRDLDLIKVAGENHPVVRKVTGLEPNAQGKLLLDFIPTRNYATVTAIEILPQSN
jgi:Malectin domain